MTECEEVAAKVWHTHHNTMKRKPITTREEAQEAARFWADGETQTIIDQLAEALWAIANNSQR